MIRKIILNIAFLFFFINLAVCQEVVTGLQSNPAIHSVKSGATISKGLATDTLNLPFFDDFSGSGIFPDPLKWSDDYVFINNTYTRDQLTTGTATFDALDNEGRLYETASSILFRADYLTSQPLKMNFPASDSLRISFFYQAGGLADIP